jgi:hypothetical protein
MNKQENILCKLLLTSAHDDKLAYFRASLFFCELFGNYNRDWECGPLFGVR